MQVFIGRKFCSLTGTVEFQNSVNFNIIEWLKDYS